MSDELELSGDLSKDARVIAYQCAENKRELKEQGDKTTASFRRVYAKIEKNQLDVRHTFKKLRGEVKTALTAKDARLASAKDSIVGKVEAATKESTKDAEDHEDRLRALEADNHRLSVKVKIAVWVGGVIGTAVLGFVIKFVLEHMAEH